MKVRFPIVAVASMLLLMAACTKSDVIPEEEVLQENRQVYSFENNDYLIDALKNAQAMQSADRMKASKDATPIYTTDEFATVVNPVGSVLHRNQQGINVNWKVESAPNLDVAGHAVTLWALIWHSAEDAFGGMHPYAMYRVAGHVVGGNGKLNISGALHEGQEADYYFTGPGSMTFQDAENDFMVFISKSHGPMVPDLMPGQILTFGGGCEGDPDGGGPMAPCSEWLFSFHF